MSTDLLTRGHARPGPGLIDPRLRARRIEVARDRGRRRLRRIGGALVLVALVAAGVAATRSPLLDVDRIRVAGADGAGRAAVEQAVGVPLRRPMVSVDTDAVAARIERLPWVAHAEVSRSWPGTVDVRVATRVPVAVAGDGTAALLVDRDGRLLGPARGRTDLPQVALDATAGSGAYLPAPRRELVAVVAALPADLRADVARGLLTTDGYGLVLRDGIRVTLGDRTRLGTKAGALEALLDQAGRDTIVTIDVRVPAASSLTRRPGTGA